MSRPFARGFTQMVLEWAKNLGYLGFKIGSKFSVENNTL